MEVFLLTLAIASATSYVVYALLYADVFASVRAWLENGGLVGALGTKVGGFFTQAALCEKCCPFWVSAFFWLLLWLAGAAGVLSCLIGTFASATLTAFVFVPAIVKSDARAK